MITLPITVIEAQQLLLVSIRLGILLFMLPFFDGAFIPRAVKFPLLMIVSLLFVYHVNIPTMSITTFSSGALIMLILKEVLYGLTISLCMRMVFTAVRIGLEFTNIQIGFSMSSVIDPSSGAQGGAITNFFYLMTLFFFLLFNGHIILFKGIAESFTLLPVGSFYLKGTLVEDVLSYSSTMFYLGFKIAAPIVSAMIILTLAMALVGKAVPTMNLMLFAFPVKIAVGFIFLLLIVELLAGEMNEFVLTFTPFMKSITKMATFS